MRARFLIFLLAATFVSCSGSKAPPIARDYPLARITEHVYVIHGPNEFPGKDNQGFYNNPGFVLTRGGVVVVDPGASVQVGEMVLKKIAGLTRDPVIAVFNTHVHGDHWLGNQAIRAAYPKAVIYAHPKMIAEIKAGEGDRWVKMLDEATQGATRGTVAVPPDVGVENGDVLRLHGMHFHIYHNARAHTDTDIMIEVPEEGVIFLGDNVLNHRIAANFPEQSDVEGQIAAVDMALGSRATHFIPGHGLSGGREIAQAERVFLVALYGSVKKYYDQGMTDFEMKEKVMDDLSAYRNWVGFDGMGRVINAAYRQIEIKSF
jgi:glyoxylase-like metal-dependent hydrolase (beta-lactamase superfamily II)